MECFNLIYAHSSVQYHDIAHVSVHISCSFQNHAVLYEIYALAFPFDLRCERATYLLNIHVIYVHHKYKIAV